MYTRIVSNWKTSTAAGVLALISFAFVWFGKASLVEVGAFWGAAGVLLFSKDA